MRLYMQRMRENPKEYALWKRKRNRARRKRYRNDPEYRKAHLIEVLKWRKSNPERSFVIRRWENGIKITWEEYLELKKVQKNRCAICGRKKSPDKRHTRLTVDHNHKTGLHRGLLCSQCNFGLGAFQDNAEFLERGAKYLRSWS
jgi:hypothetical protein